MFGCFKGNNHWDIKDESTFLRNGSMLLEKLISFCDGKCNPIRSFSIEELNRATNDCDRKLIIGDKGRFKLYKGFLQDRPVIIKKFRRELLENIVNEIVFSSVFSAQKHVLKLLGCCLENELPILVFEYADNATLEDHIFSVSRNKGSDVKGLSWKCRLKIAVDISTVIAYLHNEFPKPIIHRSLIPSNIFLNKDGGVKLSDFSKSISIPKDKFEIIEDRITGTHGYLAPEYTMIGRYNEKIDVYSFGAVLFALLSGRKPWYFTNEALIKKSVRDIDPSQREMQIGESPRVSNFSQNARLAEELLTESDLSQNDIRESRETLGDFARMCIEEHRINEIVDNTILEGGAWPGKEQQMQAFVTIAIQCLSEDVQNRPAIIEVAKQLREIYQTLTSSN